MRLFLGIPLPDELAERLAAAGRGIPGLRAQRAATIHLTIKFIGETPDPDPIVRAVEPVAAAHEPFDLVLRGLGCFPNARRANVVWVGLDRGDLQAGALAKGVEDALRPLGIPPERRPFRGHITLGRFRRPRQVVLEPADERGFGAARADRLILYASTLTPEGAVHTPVRVMSLGGGMTPGRD